MHFPRQSRIAATFFPAVLFFAGSFCAEQAAGGSVSRSLEIFSIILQTPNTDLTTMSLGMRTDADDGWDSTDKKAPPPAFSTYLRFQLPGITDYTLVTDHVTLTQSGDYTILLLQDLPPVVALTQLPARSGIIVCISVP